MSDDGQYQQSSDPEKDMLIAFKAGSPEAWRDVLSQYGPRLLAYAHRMLGDRGVAEEIVQDSLVNIYQNRNNFEGRCSLKSWLFRAVHNRSIDEIRRRKRYIDVGDDPEENFFNAAGRWRQDFIGFDGLAAKELDDRKLVKTVRVEIDHLPHKYREILLLKEIEGLEPEEICAALEISSSNFRIRLHRARTALRAVVIQTVEGN